MAQSNSLQSWYPVSSNLTLTSNIYRGIEKQYLEGLISPSSWCDSGSRNQSILDLRKASGNPVRKASADPGTKNALGNRLPTNMVS